MSEELSREYSLSPRLQVDKDKPFDAPQMKEKWVHGEEALGERLGGFIKAYVEGNGVNGRSAAEEPYDGFTELHTSGTDKNPYQLLKDGATFTTVDMFYDREGKAAKIHARVDGSSADIYVSGAALEDFRTYYERPEEEESK